MKVTFLGTQSMESKEGRLPSFLVDGVLAVDAGSLTSELSAQQQAEVKAILLSHGHYGHIKAVPAHAFGNQERVTQVVGTATALDILTSHLMDGIIYPRYGDGDSYLNRKVLDLCPIEAYQERTVEGYRVLAVPALHPAGAVGFEIEDRDGNRVLYSGDTGPGVVALWEPASPQVLVVETTFPDRLEDMARLAGHLCPKLLEEELAAFERAKKYLPRVVVIHTSPLFREEIVKEAQAMANELGLSLTMPRDGDSIAVQT